MIGSTKGRKKTTTGFWQVEESKGIGAVVSVDVFEARAMYLKPWSEEVDASGRAKGNHN